MTKNELLAESKMLGLVNVPNSEDNITLSEKDVSLLKDCIAAVKEINLDFAKIKKTITENERKQYGRYGQQSCSAHHRREW